MMHITHSDALSRRMASLFPHRKGTIPDVETSSATASDPVIPDTTASDLSAPSMTASDPAQQPQAYVIVDFNYWHFALHKLFGVEVGLKTLVDIISSKYLIQELFVAGDFGRLAHRALEVLELTENLHDIGADMPGMKNFILADKLYRCGAEYRNTDMTVILISGSGNLVPAVRFVKEQPGLHMGIYSVRGTLRATLRQSADWTIELPGDEPSMFYPLIIKDFEFISGKMIMPTFRTTVNAVSRHYNVSADMVKVSLGKMIDEHYVYRKQRLVPYTFDVINTLVVNWELLIRDGLYIPDKEDCETAI